MRYIIALVFPKHAQETVLKNILGKIGLSRNAFTHQPLTKYDDYVNLIEIIKTTGEHPGYRDEVLRLCPTSGTSGRSKLIPYTRSLKGAFQKGLYPWIFFMYLRFPMLFLKRQYWAVTPVMETRSTDATSRIKIGFEDDEAYIGALQRHITKTVWINAGEIIDCCPNVEMFLSRLAIQLAKEKMLGLVSIWSPSLISVLTKKYGAELPKNLLLSSWAHGYSKGESDGVAQILQAKLQPKGLLSTEACVTIPIGTNTFLLSYNSHYFEFRDLNTNKLETATTIKVGHEYEVVITTQSGFVRYATGDLVQVVKFVLGRPSCVFVGRMGVIDLFGEKLDELTVEKAVGTFLGSLTAKEVFWFIAPTRNEDNTVSYTLFVESKKSQVKTPEKLDALLRASYHYDYCRELGQLAQARVFVIEDSSPESRFIEVSSKENGARLGDVKTGRISKKINWDQVFFGHFI